MTRKSNNSRQFYLYDTVVVNPGVEDPDLSIDIGGWQGTIVDIDEDENGQMITISWDAATLRQMEPWIIQHCEEEDIDYKLMLLGAHEVSHAEPRESPSDDSPIGLHLRALTSYAVQQLADSPAVFQRGVQYLHSGQIHQFTAASQRITAQVYGHYGDYSVQIDDTPDGLEMTCTCPYEGAVCKHIVAVLLRFVEMDKAGIVDVSLPEVARQTLAAMPQAELLQLVFDLANERDDFRRALLARLTITPQLIAQQPRSSAQVRALKQQVAQFFNEIEQRADYGDYGDDDDYYESRYRREPYPDLTTTFDIVRTLHPLDQMEVFWYVLTCANDVEAEVPLGMSQVAEALTAYAKAAHAVITKSEERIATQKTVLDVLEWNFGDDAIVIDAVHQALNALNETPDDVRSLISLLSEKGEASFADWIAEYYLQLDDDDAYLAIRQAYLATESQHLELADFWQRKGEAVKARETLEHYITLLLEWMDQRPDQYGRPFVMVARGVLERLETLYQKAGDDANLCRILLVRARVQGVTVGLYQQVKGLAQSLGTWDEAKPMLLQLARLDRETLARIFLLEEDWDAALQLAREKSQWDFVYVEGVRPLVSRGIKAHKPQEALAIFRELVQSNIDQKNRDAYARAASYAADIKDIYCNILHDEASWQVYITDIRQRYPRHRALQEEFRGL